MENVLEIGCGNHPDKRANITIDINKNSNADMIMDVHKMTFRNNNFDKILMFEVLEHLDNPLSALKEIHRVLKPNGIFEFSIPNVYYYRLFLRWIVKGKVSASNEHIWNWSYFEIHQLLQKVGFTNIKYKMYNEKWNTGQSPMKYIIPRIGNHSIKIFATKIGDIYG